MHKSSFCLGWQKFAPLPVGGPGVTTVLVLGVWVSFGCPESVGKKRVALRKSGINA